MKKTVLIALVVTAGLILSMLLVTVVGANPTYVLLDSVNIGDTGSESGHNLVGWGPIEPLTHPGGWGGATPGSSRCRTVYYSDLDGDKSCEYGDEPWAELTLDTGGHIAKSLVIGHLDGSADDSFDVYVNGVYVDHYTGNLDGEQWVQSSYSLPDLVGQITIRIQVSNPGWTHFCYWGHLGIDWVELWGELDTDGDGVPDVDDICPYDAENDADGDGICGDVDTCPYDAENDADGDGVCGDVDNCPAVSNPDQADADGDEMGDVCDACPYDSDNDADGDGVCGDVDNCPLDANPGQEDYDDDGVGNACDGHTVVGIDIKPGSDPNAINLGSKGVIPVAILSSAGFDATFVDPTSVRLGSASVAVRGKGTLAHEEDVNGDGRMDLVVQVYTEELGFELAATEANLIAKANDWDIEGTDSIYIVPPK